MARVPVRVMGETIRAGWGLKVGTRLKVGQPYQLYERRKLSHVRRFAR